MEKFKKEEEATETFSEEEESLATSLTKEQEPKLKKMFKHYGGAEGDGETDVSISEFLLFAKECKLPQMGFSFTKVRGTRFAVPSVLFPFCRSAHLTPLCPL